MWLTDELLCHKVIKMINSAQKNMAILEGWRPYLDAHWATDLVIRCPFENSLCKIVLNCFTIFHNFNWNLFFDMLIFKNKVTLSQDLQNFLSTLRSPSTHFEIGRASASFSLGNFEKGLYRFVGPCSSPILCK